MEGGEDRGRKPRGTMERIHEREQYDDMLADIVEERLKVGTSKSCTSPHQTNIGWTFSN